MLRAPSPFRSALVVSLLASIGSTPARAEEPLTGALVPEFIFSAGYDDNIYLDAFPVGPLDTPITRDAIFDINARLAGRIGKAGHSLSLALDDLERFTISSGHIRDFDARLGYRSPALGRFELLASLGFQHWDATQFPDNRSERVAGDLGARVALVGPLEGFIGMQAAGRFYPTRDQRDLDLRPMLALRVLLPPAVSADLSYRFLHLSSTEPRAELDRHTLEVGLSTRPLRWLGLRADYALSPQHLPAGALDSTGATIPRNDIRHELHALATARPLPWLETFVEYDLLVSTSNESAGRFRRNQILVGVAAYGVFSTRFQRTSLAPQVRGQEVSFRWRGAANRVSVVGDWNGWDADAQPLEHRGGLWVGTYALPRGRHRYAMCVDGVVQPPPEADAYISDEFGGKNGLLTVR